MPITFHRMTASDGPAFASFLTGEDWPFHSATSVDVDAIERTVADGAYDNASVRTHWVVADGQRCGVVKAFDLDDGTPLFDLRIAAHHRRRGTGTAAVRWLTGYLFDLLPAINRIEGTTRVDNLAMRATFRACGFVKEAHYRDAWPRKDGVLVDAVGYAILRRDWTAGTTTPVTWADEPPTGANENGFWQKTGV